MNTSVMTGEPAGRYTHGHARAVLASHGARTAANSAAYLIPHLSSGMAVLDVGCGPGTITLDLAEIVAPGVVTGLERVEEPLTSARLTAAARGDHTTRFEQGDAMHLPYPDASFDVVHAHQVLQHLMDPVGALREMMRVCRPGGWIAARDADYAAMTWYPEIREIDGWRSVYSRIARANGGEPGAGRRMRAWSRAAGIPHAVFSTSVWTYATAEECAWWGNGQANRVLGATFVQQAAQHGISAEQVRAMATGWREWGDHPDAWFSMPHAELLARMP
ncbi:SAM-dependent methyltransferase [Okibacterium sp. HSC-33S16]|uniref:class I SAM-dependent methyltransferase n=1 Tax=Okibacterium sp. HSC-33S16 TaxID=2910965 RepID=UPI00209C9678|nr:methyltransferase domain-containing protein [Okibacterium sp. HSC-33S16]MCP2032805.1 SAM-dependent methyltransferase [Okibacterium sp. HSC-33S16]